MFIQDVFFFHEHPYVAMSHPRIISQAADRSFPRRKINIWSGGIISSPYLGPLITAFMINKEPWPNAFWVNTGLSALCLLLVVGLMDETIYNRILARDRQPVPKSRLLRLLA